MKHLFALLLLPVCALAYNPGPPTNNSATPGPPGQAYVISITGTSAANGTITFAGSGVSQGGANGRTFTFQAGAASNGLNSVVNTTNPAGVASLSGNILYIGTNALSLDTSAVLALINQSTNVGARLASNVWASADSTTNYYQSISLGGGYNWSIQITNKGGAYYLNDTNRSLSRYEGGVVTGPITNIFSITSGRIGGGNAWNGLLRMWWDAEPAYVELSPNAGGTYPLGLSLDGGAQHPIWSSYYQGSGTGMDSDLLDGLNSSAFFQSIATNGSGNVVTNLTFGGSVITQQMGTVTGGGGSTSTLYRVESQVNGVGFTTANGPTAVLTGAVTAVSAAPWVDTWEVANTITTQILSSANWSNVNFDTYAPDNPGRNYNITNDVLTFSSTGLCHVTAAARVFGMSSANRVQMMLYRNGSQFRQGIVLTATTNATPTISVSFYNHTATNTYTVAVIQEDAVAREIRGGGASGAFLVWASGYRFRNSGE